MHWDCFSFQKAYKMKAAAARKPAMLAPENAMTRFPLLVLMVRGPDGVADGSDGELVPTDPAPVTGVVGAGAVLLP